MKSKKFKVHELVPEKLYKKYGERAWKFIDDRLIEEVDRIKEKFPLGTATINNYYWGGDRHWSGLRTPESPWYSETSQHSYGRAVDIVFSEYTAEEVRQYILGHMDEFPHIRRTEADVSWLHIDLANTGEDTITLFKA